MEEPIKLTLKIISEGKIPTPKLNARPHLIAALKFVLNECGWIKPKIEDSEKCEQSQDTEPLIGKTPPEIVEKPYECSTCEKKFSGIEDGYIHSETIINYLDLFGDSQVMLSQEKHFKDSADASTVAKVNDKKMAPKVCLFYRMGAAQARLIETWKAVKCETSLSHLFEKFHRSTRGSTESKLKTLPYSKIRENSFLYPSIKLWNKAQAKVTDAKTIGQARVAIKEFVKTLPT